MPGGRCRARLRLCARARPTGARCARANGWKGGEFSSITLLADSGASVTGCATGVEALGFQAQTFGDQFRGFEDLLGRLRVALLGLALVALLLACLGIANTMYTAVLERTKEIGVLKALGARSRDVLLLFVAEARGHRAGGRRDRERWSRSASAGSATRRSIALDASRVAGAALRRVPHRRAASSVAALVAGRPAEHGAAACCRPLRAARQDPVKALRYE